MLVQHQQQKQKRVQQQLPTPKSACYHVDKQRPVMIRRMHMMITNEERVIRQRQEEAARRRRLESIRQYHALMTRASFEEGLVFHAVSRSAADRLSSLHAQRQLALAARRRRLQELLSLEDQQVHYEILTSPHIPFAARKALLEARSTATASTTEPHQTAATTSAHAPDDGLNSMCGRDAQLQAADSEQPHIILRRTSI